MIMTPPQRKFVLTAHVTFSVGWLGAVAGFLALAIAGLTSQDAHTVRGAYLVMELTGWFVIVPLALASLLTGLVQSLGSTWGLFRHYWVLAKLVINVFATIILLMYMQTLGYLATVAAEATLSDADLPGLRSPSPVLHAAGALLLLLVATTLGIYKPRGMTRYGRRKQREEGDTGMNSNRESTTSTRRWVKVLKVSGVIALVLVLLRVLLQLTGHGPGGH